MSIRRSASVFISIGLLIVPVFPAQGATRKLTPAQIRAKYKSCSRLNADYPNGVAISANVSDVVAGSTPPVANFVVDEALYLALWAGSATRSSAAPYGGKLDRDKDGIACEKL